MIWTSDDTIPEDRIRIQYSSLLGYPSAVMSCHVAGEETCTDVRQLRYRWQVAMQGMLGYELHLHKASSKIKDTVKNQIETYRRYRDLILTGEYYSLLNPFETNYSAYYYIDTNRERILLSFLQQKPEKAAPVRLAIPEALDNAAYVDEIGGEIYTAKQLSEGIIAESSEDDHFSRMWFFVRIVP